MKGRKMFEGPWIIIAIMPVGIFLICLIFDYFYSTYYQEKLYKDTEEIMKYVLNLNNKNDNEYKDFVKSKFEEAGYKRDDITFYHEEDSYIIISETRSRNVLGTITLGMLHNEENLATVKLEGSLDEYNNPVIKEYTNNMDDYDENGYKKKDEDTDTEVIDLE